MFEAEHHPLLLQSTNRRIWRSLVQPITVEVQ